MITAESQTGVTTDNLLIVALGAVLLALSAWAWTGRSRRSRWWIRWLWGPELMLGVVPGLGLCIFGLGIGMLFDLAESPVVLAIGVAWLFGAFLVGCGMFHLPKWLGPRWYTRIPASKRGPSTRDPLTAAAMAMLSGRPDATSAAEARERFGRATKLGNWRGGYVYDPDTDERTHGMSRKGTIDGRLTLLAHALVFTASKWEDTLRNKSTVVAIHAGQVTGVRVVPPRAGADGRPRAGRLYRSWFPRLVVDTVDGTHLFDVAWGHAKDVAQQLDNASTKR